MCVILFFATGSFWSAFENTQVSFLFEKVSLLPSRILLSFASLSLHHQLVKIILWFSAFFQFSLLMHLLQSSSPPKRPLGLVCPEAWAQGSPSESWAYRSPRPRSMLLPTHCFRNVLFSHPCDQPPLLFHHLYDEGTVSFDGSSCWCMPQRLVFLQALSWALFCGMRSPQ